MLWQSSCLRSAVVERARQPFKPGSRAPDLLRWIVELSSRRVLQHHAAPKFRSLSRWFYSNLMAMWQPLTAFEFTQPLSYALPRILCLCSPSRAPLCWVLDEPLPNWGLDWGLMTVNAKLNHIATQAMYISHFPSGALIWWVLAILALLLLQAESDAHHRHVLQDLLGNFQEELRKQPGKRFLVENIKLVTHLMLSRNCWQCCPEQV